MVTNFIDTDAEPVAGRRGWRNKHRDQHQHNKPIILDVNDKLDQNEDGIVTRDEFNQFGNASRVAYSFPDYFYLFPDQG